MLQIILVVIGLVGLFKRKIKVSSKREVTGTPVIILSVFYLLAAALPMLEGFTYGLVSIAILFVVTLLFVIFSKGTPVQN